MKFTTLFIAFITLFFSKLQAQNLRETVLLKGKSFKIFDKTSTDNKAETTKYEVVNDKGDKIEQIALQIDQKSKTEMFRGIYRKNSSELHFIEFNLTKSPQTMNYFVYSPNNAGKLQLIKKEFDLLEYPKDLPSKFPDNKPIHPEFPGGDEALDKWINQNLIPVLKLNSKSNEFVLTVDIDETGQAKPVNLNMLNIDAKTENIIKLKIKEMPKWKTVIQGYNVTGAAMIPISF